MSDLSGRTSSRRVESSSATDDSLNSRLQATTLDTSTGAKWSSSFSRIGTPSKSVSSYKYSSRDPFESSDYVSTGAKSKSSLKRSSSFSTLHTRPSRSDRSCKSPDYVTAAHSHLTFNHSQSNSSSHMGINHSTIQKHTSHTSPRNKSSTKDLKIKGTLLGYNPSAIGSFSSQSYRLSKQTNTSSDSHTHVHPLQMRTNNTQTQGPLAERSTSSPKSSASSQSSRSKQRKTESRSKTFSWRH